MNRSTTRLVIAVALAAYGLYVGSYVPAMLVGPTVPALLIGRIADRPRALHVGAPFPTWMRHAIGLIAPAR